MLRDRFINSLNAIDGELIDIDERICSALGPSEEEFENWGVLQDLDLTKDHRGRYINPDTVLAKIAYRGGWRNGRKCP